MVDTRGNQKYKARTATVGDVDAIRRLALRAWRVYLRFPLDEVTLRLQSGIGWLVGEEEDLRGFMLTETQSSSIALITGAVVADGWRVASYLDTILPVAEERLRSEDVTAMAQIGHAPWLTELLSRRAFTVQDRVITYEWHFQPVWVQGNTSVTIRSAQLRDLATLLSLDRRIFGPVWHKTALHFEEALARAPVFTVAEYDGDILGYQWCERNDRHAHLTRLAVRPTWEGQGVGTRLLTEALTVLVNEGVQWVTLNTQENNRRSRMLYERHGFRLIDDQVAVLWKDL